jgi:tRNA threonylcarbamoyl adenosine modification protein (Sua5/YciO/YrdC/YwlC family)
MRAKETEIIKIKKLRKDGSLSSEIVEKISNALLNEDLVVLPIDNIYGVVGLTEPKVMSRISKIRWVNKADFVHLISSFKMLNSFAHYTKFDYDFLNRVWPGEVNVILHRRNGRETKKPVTIRFPKNKFIQRVIDSVDCPLVLSKAFDKKNEILYRKEEILRRFVDRVDLIIIIEELCKKYPISTLIDISEGELKIIREGKVTSEEIKSLYFLDKDDDFVC